MIIGNGLIARAFKSYFDKDLDYIATKGIVTERFFNVKKLRKKINFNLTFPDKGFKNYL
jgi:hypothetical protein